MYKFSLLFVNYKSIFLRHLGILFFHTPILCIFPLKLISLFMCFHAQQKHDSKTVQKRFNAKGPVSQGIYNGFSHPQLTVICASQPSELRLFNWGLIPYWAKETCIQQYTLNARLETLDEKPAFKSAKRCLVIADGFYEWQWLDSKGRKKQKHLIQLHDKSLFAFAGL